MAYRLKRAYIAGLTAIALAGLAFLGALCTGQEQLSALFLEIVQRLR